jgi:hypothetical protein
VAHADAWIEYATMQSTIVRFKTPFHETVFQAKQAVTISAQEAKFGRSLVNSGSAADAAIFRRCGSGRDCHELLGRF